METVFDFRRQSSVGSDGEDLFKQYYQDLQPTKSKDRTADFVLLDGSKVELKTDTYDMAKTPNFFMEHMSDVVGQKIGGPWRAKGDSIDFFVYHYVRNKTFFWFKTGDLCHRLDELIKLDVLKPREIKNKGWTTRGFLVPRTLVKEIEHMKDNF